MYRGKYDELFVITKSHGLFSDGRADRFPEGTTAFLFSPARGLSTPVRRPHSVTCLWPHSLQANFTRVAPFSAETRLAAPHLPQVASMRVLPCFTTSALRSMVSRIRRSAS